MRTLAALLATPRHAALRHIRLLKKPLRPPLPGGPGRGGVVGGRGGLLAGQLYNGHFGANHGVHQPGSFLG